MPNRDQNIGNPATTLLITSDRKTVTTAATAERLSSTQLLCDVLVITAETDNTGIITVGGSAVVGALATRKGIPLTVGKSTVMIAPEGKKINLYDVWLDTTVNGDGATYTCW